MIYYFSGTGNSRAIALQLAEWLHEDAVSMSGESWANPSSASCIGFVFPVHAWGVPREVERFVRTIQSAPTTYCFAVFTCGDDCGLTAEDFSALLRARNVDLRYAASVFMPNTYVPLPFFDTDSPAVVADKLAEAPLRLRFIADSVEQRAVGFSEIRRGAMPWLKSRILRPLFRRFLATPRHFSVVAADCVRCGRCVSVCPLGNIRLAGARPIHGRHCTDCLACYHACPRHAIAFTRFSRGKGQYLHPDRAADFRK